MPKEPVSILVLYELILSRKDLEIDVHATEMLGRLCLDLVAERLIP